MLIYPKRNLNIFMYRKSAVFPYYRAMLCICGTSHGPVSVSVCHKSEFY